MNKGFTLIDTIVGISLMVIVFLGIFGAYQLGLHVTRQSAHRIIATSVANEFIERARNLPYAAVGVQTGFPDGSFLASDTVVRNGQTYTVQADIDFVSDDTDGSIPADTCPNDYKRVLFTVSWAGQSSGSVSLATDVAPANDIQECDVTGGMLSLTVFDALGIPVSSADVSVQDVDSAVSDTCVTDAGGVCNVLLPESPPGGEENYKITVSKIGGFSSVETFRAGDTYNGEVIATPEPGLTHATIFDGAITVMSLAIDRVSTLTVYTRSPKTSASFSDLFNNATQVAATSSAEITSGVVQLTNTAGDYDSPGQVISNTITSANLAAWDEVSFSFASPANTSATVSVLYFNGSSWALILDADLPGNGAGFAASPIDISGLDIGIYDSIRLQGDVSTSDPAATPQLQDWQVDYFEAFALGNRQFELQGTKTVGEDATAQTIYKYNETLTSDGSGVYSASDLEWDNYTFSIDPATGLDLQEINPMPQPIGINPNDSQTVIVYLEAQDSLLVAVEDSVTGNPVLSANVRLFAGSYDETQSTNENGQTLFIPLDPDLYNIEISATGYDPYSGTVNVSGDDTEIIQIVQNPS